MIALVYLCYSTVLSKSNPMKHLLILLAIFGIAFAGAHYAHTAEARDLPSTTLTVVQKSLHDSFQQEVASKGMTKRAVELHDAILVVEGRLGFQQ